MMFDKVRAGDRIWTVQLGDAVVITVEDKTFTARSLETRIPVEHAQSARFYYKDGKAYGWDAAPSAFWYRPVFEEPPPPKRMRRVRVEFRVHIFRDDISENGYAARTTYNKTACPYLDGKNCIEHFDISHEFEVEE